MAQETQSRSEQTEQEAVAVFHARADAYLDHSNSCEVKKLSSLGCVLKIESIGFVGVRKRILKGYAKVLPRAAGLMMTPFWGIRR